MKRWFKPLKWLLPLGMLGLLGLLCAVGVVWLALEGQARVQRDTAASAEDVARMRDVVSAADPRKQNLPAETVRAFRAQSHDVDLVVHDAARRLLRGAARVELAPAQARVQVSLPLRRSPWGFGRWLNADVQLRQTTGLPEVASVRVGRVPVPAGLAVWLGQRVVQHYALTDSVQAFQQMVQQVTLVPEAVVVAYVWRPEQLRSLILPRDDQDRLRVYVETLVPLVDKPQLKADAPVPLAELLGPMFEFARLRASALGGDEAVRAQENRTAIMALALYATGQSPARLVPGAAHWVQPRPRPVLLRGREDFSMHFLVSALLAAEGGGRFADAIGVYKELSDARGGSGFSFNDIAADRAGTRFGQLAVHSPLQLQERLSAEPLKDEAFMPDVADLPEFLTEAEFKAKYGQVGAPAYERMRQEIERRVSSRPLLR